MLRQIGTTLVPPKVLKSNDLPSITGRPGFGPISPSPRIAVALVTIALTCWKPGFLILFFTYYKRFDGVKYFLSY